MSDSIKFLCRFFTDNVGDANCSPIQFLDFQPHAVERVEFSDFRKNYKAGKTDELLDQTVIVGGGFYDVKQLKYLSQARKIVFWGGGIRDISKYRSFLTKKAKALPNAKKTLYGVRDVGFGDQWVPCVSCISDNFDKKYDITSEYVVFQHHRQNIDLPFPKMINDQAEFSEAVGFLGSAEKVITNSYHGAYWATLLGKEVFIYNEINDKISMLKWKPTFCEKDEWKGNTNAVTYPNALGEAREANLKFHEMVMNFIQ
ncbi:hypothetical protein [Luteolibacter sp. AS25]|uniref:hypothetical protein n=1 Tax=Luteolibacter sp. AS25 TaxID=3135776 RepID=UPI00398A5F27